MLKDQLIKPSDVGRTVITRAGDRYEVLGFGGDARFPVILPCSKTDANRYSVSGRAKVRHYTTDLIAFSDDFDGPLKSVWYNPKFEESGGLRDWRSYVTSDLALSWRDIPDIQRFLIYKNMKQLAEIHAHTNRKLEESV